MSDGGAGAAAIGSWFGTGTARAIALVFVVCGALGVVLTLGALASRPYRRLSAAYTAAPATDPDTTSDTTSDSGARAAGAPATPVAVPTAPAVLAATTTVPAPTVAERRPTDPDAAPPA